MSINVQRQNWARVPWVGLLLAAAVLSVAIVASVDAAEADEKKPPKKSEAPAEDRSVTSSDAESNESTEVEQAEDEEDKPAVKGKSKKERRRLRYERLVRSFKEDKRIVYGRHGFPSYRYRERDSDRVTEYWVYMSKRLEFVFVGNRLVRYCSR